MDRGQQVVAHRLGDPRVDAVGDDEVEVAELRRRAGRRCRPGAARRCRCRPPRSSRGPPRSARRRGRPRAPRSPAWPPPSRAGCRRRRSRSRARAPSPARAWRARAAPRPSPAGPDASARRGSSSSGRRRRACERVISAANLHAALPRSTHDFSPRHHRICLGSAHADRRGAAQHDARRPRRDVARHAQGRARAARLRGHRDRVRRADPRVVRAALGAGREPVPLRHARVRGGPPVGLDAHARRRRVASRGRRRW